MLANSAGEIVPLPPRPTFSPSAAVGPALATDLIQLPPKVERSFPTKQSHETNWDAMKPKKDDLDMFGRNVIAAAEWEKKNLYR